MIMVTVDPVIAKLELDTKNFHEELEKVKKSAEKFNEILNSGSGKGLSRIGKDAEKTEKKVQSLASKLAELRELVNIGQDLSPKNVFSKQEKEINNLIKAEEKLTELKEEDILTDKQLKTGKNNLTTSYNKLNSAVIANIANIENEHQKYARLLTLVKDLQGLSKGTKFEGKTSNLETGLERLDKLWNEGKLSVESYERALTILNSEYNKLSKSSFESILGLEKQGNAFDVLKEKLVELKRLFATVGDGKQFFESIKKYETIAIGLNKVKELMDTGKITTNQYNDSLKLLEREYNNLEKSMMKGILGLEKQGNAFEILKRKIGEVLRLPTSSLQNTEGFSRLNQQLLLLDEQFKKGELTANQYKESLRLLESEFERLNTETVRGALGFPQLNNGMRESEERATSLRKRLWDLRGIFLSLRTMFTIFGSLAVWDFGFKLIDNVRKTFQAQSEFMSQLNANAKIRGYDIEYLNRALDETAQRFQKINKYQLGETVSSIGLEFNLSAQEMKKALPVVTMVTNEYLRAGRSQEEAALAIKDILQGEIRRLSMETGVGKEELAEHGWTEDTKDVMTLFTALEEIGKSRHWDIFAEKATSVNDILAITQSRLSEFGGSLIKQISPAIVGGFNIILETIDKLNKGLDNMGEGGKVTAELLGAYAGFKTLATIVLMSSKNLGLLDIRTIGFGKSLASLILRLDQTKVAQYGFWKTLTATINGMEAGDVATMRSSKLLAARVLGIDATILKEKGWLTAMVHNKAAMKEGIDITKQAEYASLSFGQKIAYLTTNTDIATVKTKGATKALLSMGNILKWVGRISLGIIGIGFVGWLASVSEWCKTTADSIGKYHNVLAEGDDLLAKAKSSVDRYDKQLSQLTNTESDRYKRLKANRDIAAGNVKDLETARKTAKKYDDLIKKQGDINVSNKKSQLRDALQLAGVDYSKATELANGWTVAVEAGGKAELKAYEEEKKRYDSGSAHLKEMIAFRKAEKDETGKSVYAQQDLIKYAEEYSDILAQTSEHWKQFNKGDIKAGFYAILGEIQLRLKDISSDKNFIALWKSLTRLWNSLIPIAKQVYVWLSKVGTWLANITTDFLSNDTGREIAKWAVGLGIGGFALYKIGKKIIDFGKGTKDTIENLKTVKDGIRGVIDKIKDYKNETSKLPSPIPEDVRSGKYPETTELPSPIPEDKLPDKSKIGFLDRAKETFKQYGKVLGHLAGATVVVMAGLGAIALVGAEFKLLEPQIRAGIDGLRLVAPTLLAILIPVGAFTIAMEKWSLINKSFGKENIGKSAGAIAGTLALTAEVLFMLLPSLLAISTLGAFKQNTGDNIKKGIEVINETKDVLISIAIPVGLLWAALGFVGTAIAEPAAIGFVGTALAIAGMLLLVTEVIAGLQLPLGQIANLGEQYSKNSDDVKKGAEVIKLTGESLRYLSTALGSMVLINFEQMMTDAQELLGYDLKGTLDGLIKDDNTGVFDRLSSFASKFNQKNFTPIDPQKAGDLKTSATSLTNISNGVIELNKALEHLPALDENTSNIDSLALTNSRTTKELKGEAVTDDTKNKLDRLLEPIKNIKDFISKINSDEYSINTEGLSDKVTAITQVTSLISQMQSATQNLKLTLQNAGDAENARASARGGALMGIGNWLYHDTAGGDYKSSIGKSLLEMENMIDDLFVFNQHIQTKATQINDNSNTINKFSGFITTIQNQITQIKTTIDGAKPDLKEKGKSLGQVILEGFDEGTKGADEKAKNVGRNMGALFADGFKFKAHFAVSFTNDEINNIIVKIEERKPDVATKGRELGETFAQSYKDGADIHSPGIAAKATRDEIGYITQYIQDGILNLPNLAGQLGQLVSQGMTPQFNLPQLQLPDMPQIQQQITNILPIIDTLKNRFSLNFQQIQQNVGGAFRNIVNNTKTQMGTMQTNTTQHIQNIKTSWSGLQTALIGSAETIKKQVTSKITTIKTNMGDFWNKITHPDKLIGGYAGNLKTQQRRTGSFRLPPIHYAGGDNRYLNRNNDKTIVDLLKCLLTNKNCYAGGWNFNWTPKIESKYGNWRTQFKKYNIDSYTKVGSFKNSNFPVKGNSQIAKKYIFDVISRTDYAGYFDSKYGDNPVAALLAGAFNCWDGTNVVLALARAFGFGGSRGHTMWDGVPHVFARIPGLGIIDPTAIQQRGSFKAGGVRYAGSGNSQNVTNNSRGDTVINIHFNKPVYGIDDLDRKMNGIAEDVVRKINRELYL